MQHRENPILSKINCEQSSSNGNVSETWGSYSEQSEALSEKIWNEEYMDKSSDYRISWSSANGDEWPYSWK